MPCPAVDMLALSSKIYPKPTSSTPSGSQQGLRQSCRKPRVAEESDPGWDPLHMNVDEGIGGGGGGGPRRGSPCAFSSRESEGGASDDFELLFGGLGQYREGPRTEEEELF
ncbi:hypothetical protein KC19_VG074100 [Ceratodon purpureus]|uniref:Uncharacterized protein n=1 Tax=Ceratodon purpureus TaxID=3225 RepID=A0A8T0HMW3_CERPU|nr:hypothetical protein KC19_VG074100 [Ceratodon purpureus]